MPLNGRLTVEIQPRAVLDRKGPVAFVRVPVLRGDPAARLVGMLVSRPASQFLVEQVVERAEGFARNYRCIIACPATYQRIEVRNQARLVPALIPLDDGAQCVCVPPYCCCAWRNDGLEPKQCPIGILAGVRFANGMLAHVEPQEVKANLATTLQERMGDTGLAWLQFQANAFQPFGSDLLCPNDDALLFVEHDEIIRVADNHRLFAARRSNGRLQPMQRDVCQQG